MPFHTRLADDDLHDLGFPKRSATISPAREFTPRERKKNELRSRERKPLSHWNGFIMMNQKDRHAKDCQTLYSKTNSFACRQNSHLRLSNAKVPTISTHRDPVRRCVRYFWDCSILTCYMYEDIYPAGSLALKAALINYGKWSCMYDYVKTSSIRKSIQQQISGNLPIYAR